MKRPIRPVIALATVAALTSCAGAPAGRSTTMIPSPASINAYTLDREQLANQDGGLLVAMVGRVPGLRIVPGTSCSSVTLRNRATSAPGTTDPQVYVDGTRALDVCVLEMLRARDVERVEVYPTGITSRPGYQGNGSGLILVFMRER